MDLPATATSGTTRIGDPDSSEDLETLAVASPAIASAPVGGPVRIWTGKTTIRLGAPSQKTSALAFTPEGAELATGGDNGIDNRWRQCRKCLGAWPASKERITGLIVIPKGLVVGAGTAHRCGTQDGQSNRSQTR